MKPHEENWVAEGPVILTEDGNEEITVFPLDADSVDRARLAAQGASDGEAVPQPCRGRS